MKAVSWLVAGLIGGMIGAAVWAAVVQFTNTEVGIIAWGIGVLAGFGVRAAAREEMGHGPAAMALLAALLAVSAGKIGSYVLLFGLTGSPTEQDALVMLSDVVVHEWETEGRSLRWPQGSSVETAMTESEYPPAVWPEAKRRWAQYSQTEKDRYLQSYAHIDLLDTEYVVSFIADEVVIEYEQASKPLDYPPGADQDAGIVREDYPQDVWDEAMARWESMTPQERFAFEDAEVPTDSPGFGVYTISLAVSFAIASLSIWDLLWVGLAGFSAWRIGSGEYSLAES